MRRLLAVWLLSGATACSLSPERDREIPARIPDAVPRVEAKSQYGNMRTYEVFGKRYYVLDSSDGFVQKGIASWYGKKFHGKKTSSGEPYDMYAMSAAHKTLPLPSYLEVKNLENGKKAIVRVNDRGPFHANRIVDLSYVAAVKLDIARPGTALVEIRAINPRTHARGGAPVVSRTSPARKNRDPDFYIQAGAFSDPANAKKLKKKLRPLGRAIQIEKARVRGKTVFRVRIGPLNNIELADRIVARLNRFDVHDHHIVLE